MFPFSAGHSMEILTENYKRRIEKLLKKKFKTQKIQSDSTDPDVSEHSFRETDQSEKQYQRTCGFCKLDFSNKKDYMDHVNFSKLHQIAVLEYNKSIVEGVAQDGSGRSQFVSKLSASLASHKLHSASSDSTEN